MVVKAVAAVVFCTLFPTWMANSLNAPLEAPSRAMSALRGNGNVIPNRVHYTTLMLDPEADLKYRFKHFLSIYAAHLFYNPKSSISTPMPQTKLSHVRSRPQFLTMTSGRNLFCRSRRLKCAEWLLRPKPAIEQPSPASSTNPILCAWTRCMSSAHVHGLERASFAGQPCPCGKPDSPTSWNASSVAKSTTGSGFRGHTLHSTLCIQRALQTRGRPCL